MRMNYKYHHAEFPYAALIEENRKRSRAEQEFELWDTGIFADDRYFDIDIKYAKATRRICCVESLRATWAPTTRRSMCCRPFGFETPGAGNAMTRSLGSNPKKDLARLLRASSHATAGTYELHADLAQDWLFSENETNFQHLYGSPNAAPLRETPSTDASSMATALRHGTLPSAASDLAHRPRLLITT